MLSVLASRAWYVTIVLILTTPKSLSSNCLGALSSLSLHRESGSPDTSCCRRRRRSSRRS